jgi:hypothetical protein
MLHVYVDGDACSVKQEVYRVARRYRLEVTLVANTRIFVPREPGIRLVVVKGHLGAADDWIASHATADDIVITGDLPLAARCLDAGARVLSPRGRRFTEDNIGAAIGTRDLHAHLRELGTVTGGPPPFERKDRASFLQKLDEMVQAIKRRR